MPISEDLVNLRILFAEVVGFDMDMDQVTYKPKGIVEKFHKLGKGNPA